MGPSSYGSFCPPFRAFVPTLFFRFLFRSLIVMQPIPFFLFFSFLSFPFSIYPSHMRDMTLSPIHSSRLFTLLENGRISESKNHREEPVWSVLQGPH